MKDNIAVNRGRPAQILTDTLQNYTVEVRAAVGKIESVKRTIRRLKKGSLPKEPASMREIELTEEWTPTGEPYRHPFLLHDSGPESDSRMLVFVTQQGLRHLCRSNTWYMNRTHATATPLFKQIYIIRAPFG